MISFGSWSKAADKEPFFSILMKGSLPAKLNAILEFD